MMLGHHLMKFDVFLSTLMKFNDVWSTFVNFTLKLDEIQCGNLMSWGPILMENNDCWSKVDEINQIITVTGLIIPGINEATNIF